MMIEIFVYHNFVDEVYLPQGQYNTSECSMAYTISK